MSTLKVSFEINILSSLELGFEPKKNKKKLELIVPDVYLKRGKSRHSKCL